MEYFRLKMIKKRISVSPDICNGRPVVAGTRITVQTVLEFLEAGDTIENVLEEYPSLTREDIDACIQFSPTDPRHAWPPPSSSSR